MWNKTCSAEGYPLPSIDWYYNNQIVSNVSKTLYHVVRHREHSFVSKDLIINNITESSSGNYVCKLNKNQIIASIKLMVKKKETKLGLKKILIPTFIAALIFTIIITTIGVIYLRR